MKDSIKFFVKRVIEEYIHDLKECSGVYIVLLIMGISSSLIIIDERSFIDVINTEISLIDVINTEISLWWRHILFGVVTSVILPLIIISGIEIRFWR